VISMLSLLLIASAALPAQDHGASGAAYAIAAKHVLVDGKTDVVDGIVIVERGKVREVLDAKQKSKADGLPLVQHDGWISAGMIAARSHLGTRGETSEPKRALTPRARMLDAVDLRHPEFHDALHAGITTVVVSPDDSNLVGGQSATVKTHGRHVLDADANLVLSLSGSALQLNREPTSYAGAMAMLEAQFEKPAGPFVDVASGKLPVLLEVSDRGEIQRALGFAAKHKLRGALSHAPLAGELAAEVKTSGLAAIVGPFDVGESPRVLRSVVALARETVPVAFGLDSGSAPESLRLSAAMCVREGLASETAWNALTSHAAVVLGMQEHVGTLRAGCDADIVMWSGPPLELTSRVVGVIVDGVNAIGADE